MWTGKRVLQGRGREVNEARSSRFSISQGKDFKSYSQYGKGHWRVLRKLVWHVLIYID